MRDIRPGRATLALLLAWLACSPAAISAAQDGAPADKTVDPALWRAAGIVKLSRPTPPPAVILSDLSGQAVDLRQLRGQVVLVYFWATW